MRKKAIAAANTLSFLAVAICVLLFWFLWGKLGPSASEIFLSKYPALPAAPYMELSEAKYAFERAGQWGDSFGPLNALFAGLAFIGLLATLLMQGRSFQKQLDDTHKQRFESTYFELLSLLRSLRDEVRFIPTSEYRKLPQHKSRNFEMNYGAAAFKAAALEVQHHLNNAEASSRSKKTLMAKIYRSKVHIRFESTLSPYFRIIYTILRRIKEDKVLNESEKTQYANLLRSQLTTFEIYLISFNGLTKQANNLSELLEDFHMLKYIPDGAIRRSLEAAYSEKAFSPRHD